MTKPPSDLRAALKEALDEAEWSWLAPHLERQAVILVSQDLDMIEVGMKIAEDDAATVQEWIKNEQIGKPTEAQVHTWEINPTKRFTTLVVQPYVLVQERAH